VCVCGGGGGSVGKQVRPLDNAFQQDNKKHQYESASSRRCTVCGRSWQVVSPCWRVGGEALGAAAPVPLTHPERPPGCGVPISRGEGRQRRELSSEAGAPLGMCCTHGGVLPRVDVVERQQPVLA
jgi:hypothetical protein